MLKIDIDNFNDISRFRLQIILHSMPVPFFIRLSSSRTGLHITVPSCGDWDYRRYAYDDEMRIDLDTRRGFLNLPVSNLLWDVKNGIRADMWRCIKNSQQVEQFLDSIVTQSIYSPRAYYYAATKGQGVENESKRL